MPVLLCYEVKSKILPPVFLFRSRQNSYSFIVLVIIVSFRLLFVVGSATVDLFVSPKGLSHPMDRRYNGKDGLAINFPLRNNKTIMTKSSRLYLLYQTNLIRYVSHQYGPYTATQLSSHRDNRSFSATPAF